MRTRRFLDRLSFRIQLLVLRFRHWRYLEYIEVDEWLGKIDRFRRMLHDRSRQLEFLGLAYMPLPIFQKGARWDGTCKVSKERAIKYKGMPIETQGYDFEAMVPGDRRLVAIPMISRDLAYVRVKFALTLLSQVGSVYGRSWLISDFEIESFEGLEDFRRAVGVAYPDIYLALLRIHGQTTNHALEGTKKWLKEEQDLRNEALTLEARGAEFNGYASALSLRCKSEYPEPVK